MRSSRIGSSITIDDNDKCNKTDKVRSEAEALPNTRGYSTSAKTNEAVAYPDSRAW